MFRETHARSVAKALSWRVLGTVVTAGIVFAVTRRLSVSLAVGGLDFVAKVGAFWAHERLWDRVRFGKQDVQPVVLWFTGLSGAGKSTIANWVVGYLKDRSVRVEALDGDVVRQIFPNTGFTRADRDSHIRRVGFLASKLEEHGVTVVASFVSPYRDSRRFVRGACRNFLEIYVSTPLDVCEQRDAKGLYGKARSGEIRNFTGIDDPYEPPEHPDVVIDTTNLSVEQAGAMVVDLVRRRSARLLD